MKGSSIFNARKSVFSDSVLCLGRILQKTESNKAWEQRTGWITSSQIYRDFDGISGEPTEFEWNIFPGFDTLQFYGKVEDLLSRLGETPETFTRRILFMSMFNDISCDNKGNEEECLAYAKVVYSSMQRPAANTLFQEMMDHHNRKDGFREIRKLDKY